jgi:hypothetical protein
MKTTTNTFKFWLPIQLFILVTFLFPRPLVAQGNLNALVVDSGSSVVGYATQDVGWSFVPTADLLVTGISSTAPQVDFWLGTNQNIATYNYFGPYLSDQVGTPDNFQSVSSLLLSAGQTYFISTQQTNFTSEVTVFVYGLNQGGSIYGPKTFSPSPYISQFGSYYLSSSGQWSSTTTPGYNNTDYAVLGPNFQFQVVPEPSAFELLLLSVGVLILRRRAVPNFFHARQTH